MRPATDELNLTLVVSRRFVASPERVFDAWLDPNAGRVAVRDAGRDFGSMSRSMLARGFPQSTSSGDSLATHFGTYLEIVRPNRIVFTFGTERQESTTVVMVDIRRTAAGGLLTLTHRPSSPNAVGGPLSLRQLNWYCSFEAALKT